MSTYIVDESWLYSEESPEDALEQFCEENDLYNQHGFEDGQIIDVENEETGEVKKFRITTSVQVDYYFDEVDDE